MVPRSHIPQQDPGQLGDLAPEDGWGHPAFGHLDIRQIRLLLAQERMHFAARLLYALLVTHADSLGYINVPNDTIAAALQNSVDRTRHALYELRRDGYIEMVRRGGYTRPTIWRITGVQADAA